MIAIRKSEERGHFRNHWLDARFSFSFGQYQDPRYDGYSDLLVLNEDRVQPGGGFAEHPHRDIEAISYPLAGLIEHRDSLGNLARMQAGDVQVMSAGRGIVHSEMNGSTTAPEHHLQFWIRPAQTGLPPGYAQAHFPLAAKLGVLKLIVSPDGRDGSLRVHQDTRIHAAVLREVALHHPLPADRRFYLHVARGALRTGGVALAAGDAVFIEREAQLILQPEPEAEVLLFDLR